MVEDAKPCTAGLDAVAEPGGEVGGDRGGFVAAPVGVATRDCLKELALLGVGRPRRPEPKDCQQVGVVGVWQELRLALPAQATGRGLAELDGGTTADRQLTAARIEHREPAPPVGADLDGLADDTTGPGLGVVDRGRELCALDHDAEIGDSISPVCGESEVRARVLGPDPAGVVRTIGPVAQRRRRRR